MWSWPFLETSSTLDGGLVAAGAFLELPVLVLSRLPLLIGRFRKSSPFSSPYAPSDLEVLIQGCMRWIYLLSPYETSQLVAPCTEVHHTGTWFFLKCTNEHTKHTKQRKIRSHTWRYNHSHKDMMTRFKDKLLLCVFPEGSRCYDCSIRCSA